MAKRDKRPTHESRREDPSQRGVTPSRERSRTSGTRPKANPAAIIAALATIALVLIGLYWPAVDAPLFYDDSNSIIHNPSITRLWPLWGDASAPGPLQPPRETSVSGRPLVNLSLALNYHWDELGPRGYHLTNLTIHILSAWLILAIVRHTLRLPHFHGQFDASADGLACAAALLWAVHPLATDAVQYVTQRTELLMSFCYLATLYGSLCYWSAEIDRQRRLWLTVAVTACAAGMACKEVMVTAPIVMLLFDRAFVSGSLRAALTRSRTLYLGLALCWIPLVALNLSAPRSLTAGFHTGVPAYVWWFTQAKVLWLYLKLAIWPWPLVIHYDSPLVESWRAAAPWLAATGIAGLLTFALLARNTAAGFLLACFPLILAPTLVVPITTEVAAERRMYLPLVALVTLAVVGSYALAQHLRSTWSATPDRKTSSRSTILAASALAVIALLLYAGLTTRRLRVYRDEITLWQDTLQHAPKSVPVRMNLGLALVNAGRPQEAIEQYQAVLELEPEKAATHRNNLAYALIAAGRTEDAIAQYEQALRDDPESAEAHNNLAFALLNVQRPREAVQHYRNVVELKPDFAEAHLGLGMALTASGDAQEAAREFEQAARLQPDSIAAHSRLAETYAALGRNAEALESARRALALARAQGQAATAQAIETWLKSFPARATDVN